MSFGLLKVCLAKVNSAPSLDVVVGQDLCLGEGQGVENGDSLEVAYTGWLLQNHTIGQVSHRGWIHHWRSPPCCFTSLCRRMRRRLRNVLVKHCFQMFDSNLNKDKLLRLKLGAGKVIKVSRLDPEA